MKKKTAKKSAPKKKSAAKKAVRLDWCEVGLHVPGYVDYDLRLLDSGELQIGCHQHTLDYWARHGPKMIDEYYPADAEPLLYDPTNAPARWTGDAWVPRTREEAESWAATLNKDEKATARARARMNARLKKLLPVAIAQLRPVVEALKKV
jgi:hypothetical protein